MGVKSKVGVFILACAVIGIALLGFTQKEESYNTDEVLGSLSDEYAIQAIQISGDTHPTISVDAYESKDISAIKKHLGNNLSEDDLERYDIEVFSRNSIENGGKIKESYSTESVVDSLWDKYSVQSTQFDDEHPIMSITVYDEEDITKVENYLEDNLSEEDLKDYQLNVYQYSENPKEFRENAQENLASDNK